MKNRLFILMSSFVIAAFGADSWADFDPPVDTEYDWIQLTSGEWLKGDFKVMYDFEVEFDSDELDLQKFDLDDVKQLRTRNPQVVRMETGWMSTKESTVRGQLTINEGKVLIKDGEGERSYKRSDIVAIAGGVGRERDFWSGSVSVGGGCQRQDYVSVVPPEDPTVDTPFFLAGTRYDIEVNKFVDFLAEYNFRVLNEVSGT